MLFAERLKTKRKLLNLTQTEVAKHLHVTQQTISSWENGRSYPDINTLLQISNYYQISLDILLKEDTGMKEEIARKEVVNHIKPILITAIIIDLVCLITIIISVKTRQTIPDYLGYVLCGIIILNEFIMLQLQKFITELTWKTSSKPTFLKVIILIFWAIDCGLFIYGIPIFYLGIVSGIALGLTLLYAWC